MAGPLHLVCPACGAVNRLPAGRLGDNPRCGKCGQAVLDGKPVALNGATFQSFVARNDLPVVVDFWAEWCGPCKMMAPVFSQVAAELKDRVRFAKVDTEAEPELARQFGIRSIPTLALWRGGAELDRLSGAVDAATLRRWLTSRA